MGQYFRALKGSFCESIYPPRIGYQTERIAIHECYDQLNQWPVNQSWNFLTFIFIMQYPIYNFYYPDKNINQKKILIPCEIYETYKSISDVDEAKKFLKQHTKGMEWFIPGSPYYDAIDTGIVNANGRHPVVVTKVENL